MIAWRFDPRPESKHAEAALSCDGYPTYSTTPSSVDCATISPMMIGPIAQLPSFGHDQVGMFRGHDQNQPDAHIEDPIHFVERDSPAILDRLENRQHRPRAATDTRPAASRETRAAGCP